MEAPSGGELEGGGTAGEAPHGAAVVGGGDGGGCMGVGVAVVAKEEVVGGAAGGDGLATAVFADLGADMLSGEGVGRMDVVVAEQAELGRVSSAVYNRNLLIAEIAGHALSASRFGTHHLSLSVQLQTLIRTSKP